MVEEVRVEVERGDIMVKAWPSEVPVPKGWTRICDQIGRKAGLMAAAAAVVLAGCGAQTAATTTTMTTSTTPTTTTSESRTPMTGHTAEEVLAASQAGCFSNLTGVDEECMAERADSAAARLIEDAEQIGFALSVPQARRMMLDACELAYISLGNPDTWREETALLTDDERLLMGYATWTASVYAQCETEDQLSAVRFFLDSLEEDDG